MDIAVFPAGNELTEIYRKGETMPTLKKTLHNIVLYTFAIVLTSGMPMVAFATDKPGGYTYDEETGRWNTSKWVFDKNSNAYVPASSVKKSSPAPPESVTDENKTDEEASEGSDAAVDENAKAETETDITNDTDVKNDIDSESTTGDAKVSSNTKGGDAKSGQADVDALVINSVHSTVDGETSGVAFFTMDINGDVHGDITIGPAIGDAEVNKNVNLNSNTNVDNDTVLTNDVDLKAKSGDAIIEKNTEAGSATSGDANAVANVLNLINTVIAANKSFVGTINIHGNLNGDILVSPEFIPQLLESNKASAVEIDMPLSLNLNNDQNIINNVNLSATSGDATVKDNTGAGSAKTGEAQTKLTVLNLTGHKVDAKNSLLVFVNVLGKWVGMIVDAPGATSAAIGSGVTNHDINVSDTTNVNNNSKIVNNLNLDAESGDASVTSNTKAGDATSGDATASANIANIDTSEFNLTGWFGIVFINVFGSWIGSFGVDTEAGTVVPLSGTAVEAGKNNAPNLQFGFMPKVEDNAKLTSLAKATTTGKTPHDIKAQLASMMSTVSPNIPAPVQEKTMAKDLQLDNLYMIGGFAVAGMSGVWMAIRRWFQ